MDYEIKSATLTTEDDGNGGSFKTLYIVGNKKDQPDEVYINGVMYAFPEIPDTLSSGEPMLIKDAISFLGIGNTTIYKLINAGELLTVNRGGKTLLTAESVRRVKKYGHPKIPNSQYGRNPAKR